ncbi:MAG: AraC family transcriptional regulator ligand-binding domain-containing protein, partial [Pseudomonadales bacterium]
MTQRQDIVSLAEQYRVAASVGRDLQEFCDASGIDLETVAKPLKLDTDLLQKFDVLISFDKMCRLMEALASISGDDTFGLKYGQFFKFGGTGAFGLGLLNAPNFREMLSFYAKYIHITCDIDVYDLTIDNNTARASWT